METTKTKHKFKLGKTTGTNQGGGGGGWYGGSGAIVVIPKKNKINTKLTVEVEDLIWELACEIERLKENECKNSGINWLEGFNRCFEEVFYKVKKK